MYEVYSISWFGFILIIAVLILIGYFSLKTVQGPKYLERYTPWDPDQWRNILRIIGLLFFVLVNPITHGILTVLALGLYAFFIGFNRELLPSQSQLSTRSVDYGSTVSITCQAKEDTEAIYGMSILKRAIYSCPYILEDAKPKILVYGDKYELELRLSAQEYLPSFLQYLGRLGFTIINTKAT
jgi:hypothetical protein